MPEDTALTRMFEGDHPLFEQKGRPNGCTTWSADQFAELLGYRDSDSIKTAINRGMQTLVSLGITVTEHFIQEPIEGKKIPRTRLTRFGCYLVAIYCDPKKRRVAEAIQYFYRYSEECQRFMDDAESVERILIRDEISDHEKTLSTTAHNAGVIDFHFFQNAGYRGLYNMNISELRKRKGVPKERSPLDFMGKDELAANLFRITQTEAKIKREKIRGQDQCEETAEKVGKMVRQTMHEISGQRPEDLPAHEDIKKVRAELKSAGEVITSTHPAELVILPPPVTGSYLEHPEDAIE